MQPLSWGGVLDKAIHAGFHKSGIASAISVAVEMEGKYLDSSLANNPELWNEDSIVIESPIQAVNLSKRPPQVDVLMGDTMYWRIKVRSQ